MSCPHFGKDVRPGRSRVRRYPLMIMTDAMECLRTYNVPDLLNTLISIDSEKLRIFPRSSAEAEGAGCSK